MCVHNVYLLYCLQIKYCIGTVFTIKINICIVSNKNIVSL